MSSAPAQPLFVYGALRSGTTLLRLMLKHHSAIQSPGEADFLFDFVNCKPDGRWRYDREGLAKSRIFRAKNIAMPAAEVNGGDMAHALVRAMMQDVTPDGPGYMSLSIHRNAAKMHALFPDTKVIHLLRDPRDVARSSIGMGWAGTSYHGVGHWVGTEMQWDDAAYPEDQVLTVQFETLMANLEAELTRICAFLGLDFEPGMLRYYENSTYGPPDPGISQKWRQTATPREVALIEGRVGPLLAARGYDPAGDPATPGAVEGLRLNLENRWKRWRYNMRRYGLPLFLGHHAARLLRLSGIEDRLAARQEAIRIKRLQ
ncbi:MAG: sulfotransferase [Rhodobacter sp.]|nr:sulfotransferase [Rhodobacter sp.]